ncbi:MAG: 2-oxo-4-hydroxy-4-carboxy-5-ureidoimidazoline decarboxylase [Pyrinomonadaceae bacterium]
MNGIEQLNSLPHEEATAELRKCCGSANWARQMSGRRPFNNVRELFEAADRVWWGLDRQDWLEAFRSHPRIGEREAEQSVSPEARRWSEEEQRETEGATRETLLALAEADRAYRDKFGYIFIICATGKSAVEMLSRLKRRLDNDPETELCVAAEEQRRITRLRLQKLLGT